MKNFLKKIIPGFAISWYHFVLSYIGAAYYGFPSREMIVIGVLGTRGKTTTANFIWSCLTAAGYKAGLTSTANIRIGQEEILNKYHMTMPGRFVLQKNLRKMAEAGCRYAVIETPSEGVEQWRHKGVIYDATVLTVLYPEYSQAHQWSWERCKQMHLKVFAELGGQRHKIINGEKISKIIVVDSDNAEANEFLKFKADKKITYGLKNGAEITAKNVKISAQGIDFSVGSAKYHLNLFGGFNIINALAAIAVLYGLGVEPELVRQGLESLKTVPGRMEKIENDRGFTVLVDYAHDKNSLEAALQATEEIKPEKFSKIILLLGAEGGGRDKTKRPIMGEMAAKKSSFVVISNVDPYDDDPFSIMEDIARAVERFGKKRGKDLFIIEDRREGIKKALLLAKKGDIVLITGKGAEQLMIVGKSKISWDDREVVRQELRLLDMS